MNIGVLHPGNMGVSVAASIRQGGHTVYWASQGRSADTAERAKEHGLTDAGSLQGVCAASDIVSASVRRKPRANWHLMSKQRVSKVHLSMPTRFHRTVWKVSRLSCSQQG